MDKRQRVVMRLERPTPARGTVRVRMSDISQDLGGTHRMRGVLPLALIVASDLCRRRHPEMPLWIHGLLDEGAHLLTAGLVLSARKGRGVDGWGRSMLVSTVVLDIDHVPAIAGSDALSKGLYRPAPHSLLTLGLLWALARLVPRRRKAIYGSLAGVTVHLFRDMGDGSVPLLWPLSRRSFKVGYPLYACVMAILSARVATRDSDI
jgi:inner membrane protein